MVKIKRGYLSCDKPSIGSIVKRSCCFLGVNLQSPLFSSTNGPMGIWDIYDDRKWPSHFDRIMGPWICKGHRGALPCGWSLSPRPRSRPSLVPADDVPLIHGWGGMKVWLNQAAALMWEPGDSGSFIHTQIILQDLNPSFTGTTSTSPQDVCCEV